jgi:hypothetical protein
VDVAQEDMRIIIERIFGLNVSILSFTSTLVNTVRSVMRFSLHETPERGTPYGQIRIHHVV